MSDDKPALIPLPVPWSVAASDPRLELQAKAAHELDSVTLVAYFKLQDIPGAYVASDPGVPLREAFRLDESAASSPYRRIRVSFDDGCRFRLCPAVSDLEVIPTSNYDWSLVPGALQADEEVEENLRRTNEHWIRTGQAPDPGFYRVEPSSWMKELGLTATGLQHYILLADETYLEVLARGWRWEAGLAT